MLIAFALSDLNDVMTVILNVPAQTISIMAATRLYVMLYQETINPIKSHKCDCNSLPSSYFSSQSPNPSRFTGTSSPSLVVSHGGKSKVESASSACASIVDSRYSFPDYIQSSSSPIKYPLILGCNFRIGTSNRPQTSPSTLYRKKNGSTSPPILIYETRSIVSEPLPIHLEGHPFHHLHGPVGKKTRQKGTQEESPFSP